MVKEVPNLTFSKTNFTGYNLEIRGIGTQAISVTTDPAVAVALNGIPFIRNHFFEQEFYDLSNLEVLRGPQGTLYGRNATAGVVNVTTAEPTDTYESMVSADFGNYNNRRLEAMLNIPIVGDRLDFRVAGEWTKRDGYTTNELTNSSIDGRDLWSARASLRWKPTEDVEANLVWEHFSEDDNRMRTAKQLCRTDPGPTTIDGVTIPQTGSDFSIGAFSGYLSQGCLPGSLYSPSAFQLPNFTSLPAVLGAQLSQIVPGAINGTTADPYISKIQSQNLRDIQSALNPQYKAKNDIIELNTNWNVTPAFTVVSETGFSNDFLWSTEDYNRFASRPNYFISPDFSSYPAQNNPVYSTLLLPNANGIGICAGLGCGNGAPSGASCTGGTANNCLTFGKFCDPQLGCSDRFVAQDLSDEHAWQLNQEFRLASSFTGPLNFSVGGNFMHYETEENYYVFINTLTALSAAPALSATLQ